MRFFLIDFENTKSIGLNGIQLLSEEDTVYLFYSNNVDSITLEAHMNIVTSKATFQPIKLDKPGKNALDFQLVTYLGYLIGSKCTGEYYIVSRDYGFQHAINFCLNYLKIEDVLVKRVDSIEQMLNLKKQVANNIEAPQDLYLDNSHKKEYSNKKQEKHGKVDNKVNSKVYNILNQKEEHELNVEGSLDNNQLETPNMENMAISEFREETTFEEKNVKEPQQEDSKMINDYQEKKTEKVKQRNDNQDKNLEKEKQLNDNQDKNLENEKQLDEKPEIIIDNTGDSYQDDNKEDVLKVPKEIVKQIFDPTQYEKYGERSVRLFQRAESKQAFYRSMTKAFGAITGRELYTLLKKEYDNYKNKSN